MANSLAFASHRGVGCAVYCLARKAFLISLRWKSEEDSAVVRRTIMTQGVDLIKAVVENKL